MFSRIILFLSFTTIIYCQNLLVNPTDTSQSTCFKDISLYKSNSPYLVQKKGDLVCVDHEQSLLLFIILIYFD